VSLTARVRLRPQTPDRQSIVSRQPAGRARPIRPISSRMANAGVHSSRRRREGLYATGLFPGHSPVGPGRPADFSLIEESGSSTARFRGNKKVKDEQLKVRDPVLGSAARSRGPVVQGTLLVLVEALPAQRPSSTSASAERSSELPNKSRRSRLPMNSMVLDPGLSALGGFEDRRRDAELD